MINVVMLIKDRPVLTAQALYSLFHNTNGDFNLTVVDDESGEKSLVTSKETERTTVLKIHNSKGITGQARNLGVYWAEKYWGRGDWLYLSDNDVYFTEGWDKKMTWAFNSPKVQPMLRLLGGSTHPYHGANKSVEIGGSITGDSVRIDTHDAVSGYSHLMEWHTWDSYGPLDAHAKGIRQSEDWAFCQKIIHDGGVVGSIDPPVVYDCGLTDTFGNPATGADKILRYEGIIQE